MNNPDFAYKKVVACPQCGSTLLGSASKGKMGKYYPAYHCSKSGHYFRVPKAMFEQTIEDFVKRVQIAPERLDELMAAIEAAWSAKQQQATNDNQKLQERRQELETQIKVVVDRMKIVTSETAIKYMEEDIMKIESELRQLNNQPLDNGIETINMPVVLQYARYLVEHLLDILLHLRNPLRKAAFFGVLFDTTPNYEDLVGGTQKIAQIPGVNELFKLGNDENSSMVNLATPFFNSIVVEIIRWNDTIRNKCLQPNLLQFNKAM